MAESGGGGGGGEEKAASGGEEKAASSDSGLVSVAPVLEGGLAGLAGLPHAPQTNALELNLCRQLQLAPEHLEHIKGALVRVAIGGTGSHVLAPSPLPSNATHLSKRKGDAVE